MKRVALGLNIDHVATLRNVRDSFYPDPLEIALLAIDAGIDFITVHLREDRRHIRDNDVFRLKEKITVPLNLEIAPTDEMLSIAKTIKPDSVCLVPEKRNEVTTEGGLDLESSYKQIKTFIQQITGIGVRVTLFVEPDIKNIVSASKLLVNTVEIHTGFYCHNRCSKELSKIEKAAQCCQIHKIECHAGHGLDYHSAAIIANIPYISALNIGYFLIGDSIYHGIGQVVNKIRKIIDKSTKIK